MCNVGDREAEGCGRGGRGDVDSRQSLLSLSPKATSMVAGVASRLDRIHDEIAARFGNDRLEELLALLAELEHALDQTKKTEGNAHDDQAARRRAGPVRNLGARAEPQ